MLVVEGHGLPLGFHLDSAQVAEVRLAEATLDTIAVARPRGRPRQRPEMVVVDRAHDSCAFRAAPAWDGDVHPTQAPPGKVETQAGTPGRRAQRGLSLSVESATQLRL